MKVLGSFVGFICAVLVAVGLVQVAQAQKVSDQGDCLQAVVLQVGARSQKLSNATAVRDESLAHLADVLLDEKADDKKRLEAFQGFQSASADLVQVRAKNPLPDIDERCG